MSTIGQAAIRAFRNETDACRRDIEAATPARLALSLYPPQGEITLTYETARALLAEYDELTTALLGSFGIKGRLLM